MKLASSEARNKAAWAVSQAVPILPRSGTRALRASRTASVDDPIASMELTGHGFRELARRCRGIAPRVAAVLEGGYNLSTLPRLVDAALDGFGG